MNSLAELNVTYDQWKSMRTFLGGQVNSYFIQTTFGYTIVLVDLSRKFITLSHLRTGNSVGEVSIVDFETNLKDTSIEQDTIDDCVAAAIMGA